MGEEKTIQSESDCHDMIYAYLLKRRFDPSVQVTWRPHAGYYSTCLYFPDGQGGEIPIHTFFWNGDTYATVEYVLDSALLRG